jgi:hypothetical protein
VAEREPDPKLLHLVAINTFYPFNFRILPVYAKIVPVLCCCI